MDASEAILMLGKFVAKDIEEDGFKHGQHDAEFDFIFTPNPYAVNTPEWTMWDQGHYLGMEDVRYSK